VKSTIFLTLFMLLLFSCVSPTVPKNITDTVHKASDFFIVDCLLPGQIRKLGQLATYLTARKALKTTANDCEIRGGEYVAYDRANYATSLKIWLPKAQAGDAEAQTYVGEIYDKGLGLTPDYAIAAKWYQKAAIQGNSRAQINLGYLYEQGLGVAQNKNEAMRWYRKSSGLANIDLPYATTLNDATTLSLNTEINSLNAALIAGQQQTNQLQQQLQQTQQQLAENRKSANKVVVATLEKDYQQQIQRLETALTATEKRAQQLADDKQRSQSSFSSQQHKLLITQARLASMEKKLLQFNQQTELVALEKAQQQTQIDELKVKIKTRQQQQMTKPTATTLAATKTQLLSMEKRLAQFKKNIATAKIKTTQQKTQITQLKAQIKRLQQQTNTQNLAKQPILEIIEPPVVQIRGQSTVTLRSMVKQREIIGKVTTQTSILSLLVNDQKQTLDQQGLFKTTIPIRRGKTPVNIVAVDNKGGRSSLDFVFSLDNAVSTSTEKINPSSSQKFAWNSLNFGRYYALIIGNNNYRKVPALETPVNDAKKVAQLLTQKYGFKTQLLLNASRYQILSALNKLRANLTAQDNLLIYYAGHGELDKVNMRGHWLPIDAESDNTANWISTVAITDILNAMSIKHIMVVADSCYSGAMTRNSLPRIESGYSKTQQKAWFEAMLNAKSRTVLTSGGLKPVMDGGGGQHSVFANAFIKALNENNSLLEGQALYRLVSSGIIKIAAGYGIEQVPIYAPIRHAGHESGEFFFIPKM
jgi:uncharacterized caspase-like protein